MPQSDTQHQQDTPHHVLALDTATKIQAIALLRDDTPLEDVQHRVAFDHGSSLLTNVSETLDEHDLAPDDLDLISVGIGPGSFTGLRISLALAKGLAIGSNIPIVSVSSLAALAYPHARNFPSATIIPAYDARRQEVFCGMYAWQPDPVDGDESDVSTPRTLQQLDDDRAIPARQLRSRLEERIGPQPNANTPPDSPNLVLVGNGPDTYDCLSDWSDPRVRIIPSWMGRVTAVAAGFLGRSVVSSSGSDDTSTLEPNYIRASSAEEARQAGDLPDVPT